METDDQEKEASELTTTQHTNDTQIIPDDASSTVPKTSVSNADQEAKKLPPVDINERDIKGAAASALAAAAVKAKVCSLSIISMIIFSTFFLFDIF